MSERTVIDDQETYNEEGTECPYCGHVDAASDSDGALYRDDLHEVKCGNCQKPFVADFYVSYSWTCTPYADLVDDKEEDEDA